MNTFHLHQHIKRRKEQRFDDEKRRVDGSRIILQVDFAENFDVEFQNETQSSHWAKSEVNDPTGRRVDSTVSFVEIIQPSTQITLKSNDEAVANES